MRKEIKEMFKKLFNRYKDRKSVKELNARIFQHRYAVLGAYLMKCFADSVSDKNNKGASIPDFIIEETALKFAAKQIQSYISLGVFNEKYEEAYKAIGSLLPSDYTC